MTAWVPVSGGKSAARVWRAPGRYRKVGPPDEIRAEAERLSWLRGQGIACPPVVRHRTGVLETGALEGRSGRESWPEALRPRLVASTVLALRSLHTLPLAGCPFDRSLAATVPAAESAVVLGQVDLDDLDPERRGWSGRDLLAELHRTVPNEEDLVVCHGDPTLANLIFDAEGGLVGMVDVGRLGRADRYLDLAIAARSVAGDLGKKWAEQLLGDYGLDRPDRARLYFYRLLDEFF